MPCEERREEEERCRHQAPALVEWDAARPQQEREGGDERRGEERRVQPERSPPEEHVGDQAESEAGDQQQHAHALPSRHRRGTLLASLEESVKRAGGPAGPAEPPCPPV